MHSVTRVILISLGLVLFAGGVLLGVLGFWGVTRGGSGAWLLTGIGAVALGAGCSLVAFAMRGRRAR